MKNKYNYLFLVLIVLSIFFSISSCSNYSNEEEDDDIDMNSNINSTIDNSNDINANTSKNKNTNYTPVKQDSFFTLSLQDQQAHWLNAKNTCHSGWDIHPYKKCSLKDDDARNYKSSNFATCDIESEKHECKTCRNPSFGIESAAIIKKEAFTRDYPKDVDVFAPNPEKSMLEFRGKPGGRYPGPVVVKTLAYNPLPNLYDYCSSQIPNLKAEFQKQYPNHIVYVTLVSTNFKLPSGQLLQDPMLHGIRMERLRPFTEKNMYECDITFNPLDRILHALASCHYNLDVQLPTYKEASNCEVCGRIDEINFNTCKACGIDENTIVRTSNSLSKQDVEEKHGTILACKTCDDISFDLLNMNDKKNKENIIKKIMCLKNSLNQCKEEDSVRSYMELELNRLKHYANNK